MSGTGSIKAIAEARARALLNEGAAPLMIEVHSLASGPVIYVADPSGGLPQSLRFQLNTAGDRAALCDYLSSGKPNRIEIVDPAQVPFALLDLLLTLKLPIDLLIADAGLACARGTLLRDDGTVCDAIGSESACERCLHRSGASPEMTIDIWRRRWRDIAIQADRILAPSAHAREFARLLIDRPVTELVQPRQIFKWEQRDRKAAGENRVGFVVTGVTAADHRLICDLARAIRLTHPELSIVVVGSTLDDLGLMKIGSVFVTGPVELEQIPRVVDHYGLAALFVATRRPQFGHPLTDGLAGSELPTAFFDWSFGAFPGKPSDLSLDPRATIEALAAALTGWFLRGARRNPPTPLKKVHLSGQADTDAQFPT